jgi:hypothetical protein
MTRELALVLIIAFGVLLLAGMVWSITRRRRRGSLLTPFPPASGVTGESLGVFGLLHVATTLAHTPLERVWTNPLAYRAKSTLEVTSGGLRITLRGEGDLGIPASDLLGAGRGTWTIDKAVDGDGLIVLTWRHEEVNYDSYFRSVDQPAEHVLEPIHTMQSQHPEGSA